MNVSTTLKIPNAWSYSAYEMWAQCPHRYHGMKILKMSDPPSQALLDGRVFHDEVAKHITRPDAPLPSRPIHKNIMPLVDQLRGMDDKVVEMQWALTPEWKPTGWFSRNPSKPTWLRVILDAGVVYPDDTATVVDWKTGKRYASNDDQMELFAVTTFHYWPQLQEVETRLLYVDNGAEEQAEFKRADEPKLRAKWEARAQTMLSDRTWAPKPNDKCVFCVRSRAKGGDCRFG